MKKFYYLFIGLMAVSFGSCDENARLARDIQGSWAGTPERLNDAEDVTSTIVETFTFTPDAVNPKAKKGNVTITGNVSTTIPIAVSPVSISAAATTSIQGSWSIIDDDEIALVLDPKSLQVKVDPEAVTVSNDIFTDKTSRRSTLCAAKSLPISAHKYAAMLKLAICRSSILTTLK